MWIYNQYHEIGQSRKAFPICRQNIKDDIIDFKMKVIYDKFENIDLIKFRIGIYIYILKYYKLYQSKNLWIKFKILEAPLEDVKLSTKKLLHNVFHP